MRCDMLPPEYSEFCFFSVYSRGSISLSGWNLQFIVFFFDLLWYNYIVSTSGQIRLRLARDQKAGGVVPAGTDAFFPAEVPSAPVHPDTVTHGHGDTVAGHVASVYACLVVAVYGDWVLS